LLFYRFFKGVWNRLHRDFNPTCSAVAIDVDATKTASICDPVKGLDSFEEAKDFPEENESPVAEDDGPLLEERTVVSGTVYSENHSILHGVNEREKDNHDELKEMKDLIKSAALWLSERDAENDARARARGGGAGGGPLAPPTRQATDISPNCERPCDRHIFYKSIEEKNEAATTTRHGDIFPLCRRR